MTEKKEKNKPKQYLIVLKTKDSENKQMYISADEVMPTFVFGESVPMILATIDDRGYFIPISSIDWFEQTYGVLDDKQLARKYYEEKRQSLSKKHNDVSIG